MSTLNIRLVSKTCLLLAHNSARSFLIQYLVQSGMFFRIQLPKMISRAVANSYMDVYPCTP